MKKTARIGKKVVTFFVTAGLVAGSALPVYAAMVGSMAVEEIRLYSQSQNRCLREML